MHFLVDRVRDIYDRAIAFFTSAAQQAAQAMQRDDAGDPYHHPQLYISFAKFEERVKEFERAKAIYLYALQEALPPSKRPAVLSALATFEKCHGATQQDVEDVVLGRRRMQYEEVPLCD